MRPAGAAAAETVWNPCKSVFIKVCMTAFSYRYDEHAEDVLTAWLNWRSAKPTALVLLTGTVGGAVRAPGAMMAVSADGAVAGYLSGGCIDADVALQAAQALEKCEVRRIRYGAGSPFIDLPLPCGGAIDLVILPDPDADALRRLRDLLAARRCALLTIEEDGALAARHGSGADPSSGESGEEATFRYTPKLKLRIAGRGADCLALAGLAQANGIAVNLFCRDGEDAALAAACGLSAIERLTTPASLPAVKDDAWTAFVLMFHDPDWETSLLAQALAGPAFYVGAVGSRKTHAQRRLHLAGAGVRPAEIRRVRGPVGLIPSMRDASMLAVSVLAEIVDAYHATKKATFSDTALLLLAAGTSSRFGNDDKLMAPLDGRPLLAHAAARLPHDAAAARIAVTGPDQKARARCLTDLGWEIAVNPSPEQGQASSIAAGVEQASAQDDAACALIMLGDMPFIPDSHLRNLKKALTDGASAVMTEADGVLSPPALFRRETFSDLKSLSGDAGARGLFQKMAGTATVPLAAANALDVDTSADLAAAERLRLTTVV